METQHTHEHQHGHERIDGHQHGHQQSFAEADMAENLDLDAQLLHEHLSEIIAWTATYQQAPTMIMDLGAGTGTGTLGLAKAFPAAKLLAVDYSEFMLERLAANMAGHNLSDRVTTAQVDLDTAWPELESADAAGVDLVWAALSMHHLNDPDAVFGNIARTLSSQGLLVVVEMDGWPRYLPHDLGFGVPGLEQRCHDAVGSAGWNTYPDWAIAIEAAGLTMIEQRTFSYSSQSAGDPSASQDSKLIARAAQIFLTKVRTSHAENLSGPDLEALDQLLDPNSSNFLGNRSDLTVSATRVAWAARKI
ncbi:methyltransferase [Jonesiaceae bacterium BS-20]|uniref:Methyltransferase n=1 Tax=Jonesiaceae bacterium BS-20 TaxID=3120821 RepID=A0AAU7DTP9_9MICO